MQAQCQQILGQFPGAADALHLLGLVHAKAGNHEERARLFGNAVRKQPAAPAVHNNLGIALKKPGRIAEAIGHFERAIALKLDYVDAHNNLGSGRLVFARHVAPDEHLARHALADLFPDTLSYNAHTTATDALWAGLPVLTRIGRTFAGRVGARLLRAVGLPELITTTKAEFEALAVALAGDYNRLSTLRERLGRSATGSPLFDTLRFTKQLEAPCALMVERQREGPPLEHFAIAPLAS